MSEYIHEVVLQEYIIEKMAQLNLSVTYKGSSRMRLVDAKPNHTGTFWDLLGKLENDVWIPIEVEWTTKNFTRHKHQNDANFEKFKNKNGVLLVLRKTKELPNIQQISIFDSISESQFKSEFKSWFSKKSPEYIDRTLKEYMIGAYKRELPRIILYPLNQKARNNYFPNDEFYRKNNTGPSIIGFRTAGYNKNVFIRDLQPNDIILFIASDGTRCTRAEFMNRIKAGELSLYKFAAYRTKEKIVEKGKSGLGVDAEYWPDEIKKHKMIYRYICAIENHPFFLQNNCTFPFIKTYSESTWEAFRSCIQYGEYREISSLDFTVFVSSL